MKYFLMVALLVVLQLPQVGCADGSTRTVDMTKPILDEKGKPVTDMAEATKENPTCKGCPVFTVGTAISRALNGTYQGENIAGDQKWARSILAARIKDDSSAKLTAKEVTLIVTLVEKAWPGDVIKQIIPLIDPNQKAPELQ